MVHFGRFISNFDKCWSEIAGDVISGVAVDWVGMDLFLEFGEARLNTNRIIGLIAVQTRYTHFCAVFIFKVGKYF